MATQPFDPTSILSDFVKDDRPTPPAIKLTEEQEEAVAEIHDWFYSNERQIFLLDGGAGTGKSTVAGYVISEFLLKNPIFGAYTAKAARVMSEKGMIGATTLHRMLYKWMPAFKEWRETYPNGIPKTSDLIVVDEVSMVNDKMVEDILRYQKPVLVLGDIEGQLPPIEGAGAFVRRRPDFQLREVHRTAAQSPINRLAWAVRRGYDPRPGDEVASHLDALVERFLPASWSHIINRDWQVICGKHKTREAVTRRCREEVGATGRTPQPGEPIICCRNDYNRGLLNGDMAVVWRIKKDDPSKDYFVADILIDSEEVHDVEIWRDLFERHFTAVEPPENRNYWKHTLFDWAYAITVHKAQGSEWHNVIFIDDRFAKWDKDLRRRLLYTAFTRAREKLLVLQAG